jgi:hypothetical protein
MKINLNMSTEEKHLYEAIVEEMIRQAARLTVYYGIQILAHEDKNDKYNHIYFKMGDRTFESLRDLRKALRLKAFL